MKGFRQHTLDFEIIPTGNPKTIVFIDSSDYFREPEKPLLEITLPGYNKYFLLNIVARKVNTFNSNTIGLTTLLNGGELIDLPDGIYTYKYKICPYDELYIIKKVFRTTLIDQQLGELYLQIADTDCSVVEDRVKFYQLVEIHSLIEGAKAVVEKDEKKANSFYSTAQKLIDELKEGICNKNCK
jgi:hypothetical protein